MNIRTVNKTSLLLRLGLATMFLYASISSFLTPNEWIGYFPQFMRDIVPAELLLPVFSIYEMLLAAWLLSGLYVKYAALLCAATLAGIVAANFQLFVVTFRDMALIFAAIALYFEESKK